MNVLESSQYLIEKVAHVIVAEMLRLEQLVHVRLHDRLDDVPKKIDHAPRPQSRNTRSICRRGWKKCVFLSQWIHVSEFADRRWVENVANVDDLKKGGKESRFAHSIEARIDTYARKSQARRGRGRGGDPRGKFEMAIAVAEKRRADYVRFRA